MPTFRFGPGPDGFARFGHNLPPNLNLCCRSGSVTMPNLGPDLGPVRLGSGPDRTEVQNRTAATLGPAQTKTQSGNSRNEKVKFPA
jgi:hypothetical protein